MGLMSPGMERLLDIPEFQQVLSSYDGDFRDPLWRPQETPVIMRVARALNSPLSMDNTKITNSYETAIYG